MAIKFISYHHQVSTVSKEETYRSVNTWAFTQSFKTLNTRTMLELIQKVYFPLIKWEFYSNENSRTQETRRHFFCIKHVSLLFPKTKCSFPLFPIIIIVLIVVVCLFCCMYICIWLLCLYAYLCAIRVSPEARRGCQINWNWS